MTDTTNIKDLILTLCLNNDLHPDKKKQVLNILMGADTVAKKKKDTIDKPKEEKPVKEKVVKEKPEPLKRGRRFKEADTYADLSKPYVPIEIPPLTKDMTPEEKRQRSLIVMRANKQKRYYTDPSFREANINRALQRYHSNKPACEE